MNSDSFSPTKAESEMQAARDRREIGQAMLRLTSSERGRSALKVLLPFLDEWLGLDDQNKDACIRLIQQSEIYAGTVLEFLREEVGAL